MRSRTISPVDDASATTRLTPPNRVLSWWWSTLTTSGALCSTSGSGPSRLSLAQSSARRTRVAASSGTLRGRSSRGIHEYSRGSGASPARYMTESLPSWSSANFIAKRDPSASPSGFSWVVTRKRSCARIASAVSVMTVMSVLSDRPVISDGRRAKLAALYRHGERCLSQIIRCRLGRAHRSKAPLAVPTFRTTGSARRPSAVADQNNRSPSTYRSPSSRPSGASSSISCDMRTPSATEGSYSKVSCGVRFSLSSLASRDWSTPCADSSPCSVFSRLRSLPRTLTKTFACRRSGDVSTPVRVPDPTRGSLSSPTASASVSRIASFTRRIRSVIGPHDAFLHGQELVLLAVEVADRLLEQALGIVVLPRRARDRQARPLPLLVMVDLGHRSAEAVLQLRLRRLDVLALALQRPRLREMELDGEDSDEAGAQVAAGVAAGAFRSVRSTSRTS